MKTSQLRLGNLIKIKKPILKDLIDEGFQKIYTDRTTVIYVGYDYLGVIIDNSEVEIMLQDIEPIPLTEEWLLKFGFTLVDGWYRKNGLSLMNINNHYFRANFPIRIDITSVHQLQNLYFALTREELTIKQTESI